MNNIVKRFEPLIIAGLLVWGAAFLLRLPHMQVWVIMPVCVAYLWAIYAFVKARYGVKIPLRAPVFSLGLSGARQRWQYEIRRLVQACTTRNSHTFSMTISRTPPCPP